MSEEGACEGSAFVPERFHRTRLLSRSGGGGRPGGTRPASAKSATTGAWSLPAKSAQMSQWVHASASSTCRGAVHQRAQASKEHQGHGIASFAA